MDGSKLSGAVVADSAPEERRYDDLYMQRFPDGEPMVKGVEQSMHDLALGDFEIDQNDYLEKGSTKDIDPALLKRFDGKKTDLTQSVYTKSIDSAYGDSITSTTSSLGYGSLRYEHSSITKMTPQHLQPVPETLPKVQGQECGQDEGIEDDVPLPEKCSFDEAVPSSAGTLFEKNQDGDTILHLNIIFMLTQRTFEIIASVPDKECLNVVNHMMQTPLILAALTKQTKVVRRLMVAGADIEKTDRHGDTALHIACRNGDSQMVKQISTPISAEEMRMYPCSYKTGVQRIPQDLNARDYDGFTPFQLATLEGNYDVMALLAELGADVDAQEGKNGKRAIHLAVELNNEQTIRHLVEECGVDIDATTFYNLSPIMLASEKRYHRVVEYLVQRGADHSDLDCSEVEDDSDGSEDIEMFDDFMINGEPIQS